VSGTLLARADLRTPRLRVLAAGQPLAGVEWAEVTSNNHYGADHFALAVALGAAGPAGAAFWAATADIAIDVQFSLDGLAFISLLQGSVDTVELDPVRGTLRLDGRDRSAPLIETRTQETFANRTASEIAAILAGRHGLQAQVTATTTPVGRYYQAEHDRITLDQFSRATTEWDLLAFLARQEGFDLFVSGNTLFFQPQSPDGAAPLAVLTPADVTDLRCERALTLARDIEVTVKSWNSRQQNAFTQTARGPSRRQGGSGGGTGAGGPPQRYVFVQPNLTPDQALKLAQARLAELSRHERVVSITMPGELAITPRGRIALAGTGTAFDQSYYVDRIARRLHAHGGFTQHLRARNTSPASQATTPADIVGSVTN
jgi:phage protein D